MKIFVDTNVFLDIFLKREPFVNDSLLTISKITKEMEGFVSPITITNMNFIMRKETREDREKAIRYIIKRFKFVELNKDIFEKALLTDFKDFEDSVQFISAKISDCEAIVTRDKDDFETSTINVFTPKEFLEFYK